jgi:uncharacterized protein (TIGR04141 family)
MPMAQPPITIFQIKSEFTDPDEIIVDRDSLFTAPVRTAGGLLGILYVRPSFPKMPVWASYFAGAADLSELPIEVAASGALLLLGHEDRLYALVFGLGRYMLYDDVAEPRFGLRVVLNSIDHRRIRSVDHKRLEAVSRHTREQLSRESGMEHFGLDVERDLLRAVTGTPLDEQLGKRLTGADGLTVSAPAPIHELRRLLRQYAELAGRDAYRQHFSWVDNIAEVSDGSLQDTLNDQLLTCIKGGQTDRIWLAPPEILDWSDFGGFRYRSAQSASLYQHLELEDYLRDTRPVDEISPTSLRKDRVRYVSSSHGGEKSWSLFRCVVAELELRDRTYVLSDGKWYAVDRDFLAEVDHAVSEVPVLSTRLPPYQDKSELAYNSRVADSSNNDLFLMDRKMIQSPRRGQVEFCDLFSRDKKMIHVKHYGGSSVLSHLFNQGVVSAQLLHSERMFRAAVNEVLPSTHQLAHPARPIVPSDFEIAYAVISKPGRDVSLPFFSRLTLRNAVQLLQGLGYHVSLTMIPHRVS